MKGKGKKQPLLNLLTGRFPEESREALFAKVLCGDVFVDGVATRSPKDLFEPNVEIVLSSQGFVGRGGFKLDPILEAWKISVAGRVFLDAGCSTGGFTDALLQRGATGVHAVDVGTGVLDWKLRADERVWVHEGTNVMSLDVLDPQPHAAVADLSFRSLRGAAAKILGLTIDHELIALAKPQFEWKNPPPSFDGVVAEDRIPEILDELKEDLQREGVVWKKAAPSSVRGRRGNQEFLVWLSLAD